MKPVIQWLATGLLLGACSAPAPLSIPPFRPAVEAHLAAVSARDMGALLPTLTTGVELTMIAPNGFKFDAREQYVVFHRQWFATTDVGRLTTEIVRLIESAALGPGTGWLVSTVPA